MGMGGGGHWKGLRALRGTPKGWTPTTIPSRSPKNAREFELEDQVSAWPQTSHTTSNEPEKYSNSQLACTAEWAQSASAGAKLIPARQCKPICEPCAEHLSARMGGPSKQQQQSARIDYPYRRGQRGRVC
jgi:hypothetical protein